jgi:hypothetical protein
MAKGARGLEKEQREKATPCIYVTVICALRINDAVSCTYITIIA